MIYFSEDTVNLLKSAHIIHHTFKYIKNGMSTFNKYSNVNSSYSLTDIVFNKLNCLQKRECAINLNHIIRSCDHFTEMAVPCFHSKNF